MVEPVDTLIERADLLVELGCEELPPKALDAIRESFFKAVSSGLEKNNIDFDSNTSRAYSSPRRLAIQLVNVAAVQPDQNQERRGPALTAAFDDEGRPTAAAKGFARSVGKDVSELVTIKSDKGAWLHTRINQPGKSLAELIYPVLEQAIRQLPVPRPMRWSDHEFSFVRPVHWLVVMHGDRVIEGSLLGKSAGNLTWGHRIHSPGPHELGSCSDYGDTLERAYVKVDQDQRRSLIREVLENADANVHIDASLLDEVNNLVEWPVAVECEFEEEFLEVPHAALIASMQDHQKFFPVLDAENPGRVSNRFIAISNIESTHVESVREGYERVIRPRLADARFFLEQDLKHPLEFYSARLDYVVFQKDIGSIGDKSRRISSISKKLADLLSIDQFAPCRAAALAKCDLMTQMVGEFPELQGVMGRHYALSSGEPVDVAEAIGDHYAPRFSGDRIPSTPSGQIVSIADRADTLVGVFAAGMRPSGNKDPFALRRAALGLVRILLEAGLELSLNRLLALASNELSNQLEVDSSLLLEIREFLIERIRSLYREQGYSADLISAALNSDWNTLPDLDRRIKALSSFMGQDAAKSLAMANKRIGNILRKSKQTVSEKIDANLFVLAEEDVLFEEITKIDIELVPLLNQGDYGAGMQLLAGLRAPVDDYFDSVMVMDEDLKLRANRLALLTQLKSLFDRIADLSVLG